MIAVAPPGKSSPVGEPLLLPRLRPLAPGLETRVKGFDPFSAPRVRLPTVEAPDPLSGIGRRYDGLVTGVTLYANGDPVNSWDPSGHGPMCTKGPDCQDLQATFGSSGNGSLASIDAATHAPGYSGARSQQAYGSATYKPGPRSSIVAHTAAQFFLSSQTLARNRVEALNVDNAPPVPADELQFIAQLQRQDMQPQDVFQQIQQDNQGGGVGGFFGSVGGVLSSGASGVWGDVQSIASHCASGWTSAAECVAAAPGAVAAAPLTAPAAIALSQTDYITIQGNVADDIPLIGRYLPGWLKLSGSLIIDRNLHAYIGGGGQVTRGKRSFFAGAGFVPGCQHDESCISGFITGASASVGGAIPSVLPVNPLGTLRPSR